MQIDTEHLRQRYASLSDDELIAIDRNELTEVAQYCYDREVERRGLSVQERDSIAEDDIAIEDWEENSPSVEAGDDESFVACVFTEHSGESCAADAADARAALEAAGIPSRIETRLVESESTTRRRYMEYQVIVPSALTLHATSVLDKEVFNPKMESDWKTHLESLTDEQLQCLSADSICAGFLDRAARLKKVYINEVRRRNIT
jgi:hypothetical protein